MRIRNKPLLLSFLMAIPLATVIILLSPDIFNKYEIELVEQQFSRKSNSYTHYFDLNSDGINDKITEFEADFTNHAAISVKLANTFIDQYNFNGFYPPRNYASVKFGDYNNDGNHELYFITRRSDSAFLNIFSLNQNNKIEINNEVFLNKVYKTESGMYDFNGVINAFADVNNDEYEEVYFALRSYYSKKPRKAFMYDIKADRIMATPNFAGKPAIRRICVSNNQPRVLLVTTSSANIPDSADAIGSDLKEQLFLLDTSMKITKGPVNFGRYRSGQGVHYNEGVNCQIFTYCIEDKTKNGQIIANLREYDHRLNLVKQTAIPLPFNYNEIRKIKWINDRPLLFTHDAILSLNLKEQSLEKLRSFDNNLAVPYLITDLDDSPDDEVILTNHKNEIIILDDNLKSTTAIECPVSLRNKADITKIPNAENNEFLVQNKNQTSILSYNKNQYYYLQYPFYIGIYLLIVGFLHIITRYTRNTMENKYALEHELRRLQILSTKNQTSPHFTYNLLNSVSMAILDQDRKKAQKIISKMAMLMRSALDASESIERTLEEELEFVKNYLALEKERFEGTLEFSINIETGVNRYLPVPKMLVQIFAENAVKHGLRAKLSKDGIIAISVFQEQNKVIITITDNGLGREEAKYKSEYSTGQGFKILDKIIDHYKALNEQTISYRLIDLHNDRNQPAGTKVIIEIE